MRVASGRSEHDVWEILEIGHHGLDLPAQIVGDFVERSPMYVVNSVHTMHSEYGVYTVAYMR